MDARANGGGPAPQHVAVGAGQSATGYRRHRPAESVLYQVVEANAEAFFAHLDEHDSSLPGFVRDEFEAYLGCGRLERGFVRAKCTGCRHEYLVAFSCKRRGWCPSCGARRMVETAAHLVEHVLPRAPMRQWVLSFPWPLRLLFAAHPEWLTRVLAIVTRALSSALLERAGYRPGPGAQTGIVTFIQRFGSKLNLNVHLHLLALDGAYTFEHGKAHFHRARAPYPGELEVLLDTLVRRITRTLLRAGVLVEDPAQPFLDLPLDSPLAQLCGAAVRYVIAVGPQAGRATIAALEDEARTAQAELAEMRKLVTHQSAASKRQSAELDERRAKATRSDLTVAALKREQEIAYGQLGALRQQLTQQEPPPQLRTEAPPEPSPDIRPLDHSKMRIERRADGYIHAVIHDDAGLRFHIQRDGLRKMTAINVSALEQGAVAIENQSPPAST